MHTLVKSELNVSPGRWLHEAIVGAFNARGVGFDRWCQENNISPAMARASTYGQAGGPIGKKRLKKIIEAAGREVSVVR